jgi:hypothetical protein
VPADLSDVALAKSEALATEEGTLAHFRHFKLFIPYSLLISFHTFSGVIGRESNRTPTAS